MPVWFLVVKYRKTETKQKKTKQKSKAPQAVPGLEESQLNPGFTSFSLWVGVSVVGYQSTHQVMILCLFSSALEKSLIRKGRCTRRECLSSKASIDILRIFYFLYSFFFLFRFLNVTEVKVHSLGLCIFAYVHHEGLFSEVFSVKTTPPPLSFLQH